ncbi:MAG: hypothetical protein KC731_16330 [Myxococcales bacterium]|nr:hypothetical protein [Myxococcales bacterium]
MRCDIRATNAPFPPMLQDASRRLVERALSRWQSRIERVSAVITDVNGPRGGIDMRCRLAVVGRDGWVVRVDEVGQTTGEAIRVGVRRLAHAVRRRLERS